MKMNTENIQHEHIIRNDEYGNKDKLNNRMNHHIFQNQNPNYRNTNEILYFAIERETFLFENVFEFERSGRHFWFQFSLNSHFHSFEVYVYGL